MYLFYYSLIKGYNSYLYQVRLLMSMCTMLWLVLMFICDLMCRLLVVYYSMLLYSVVL